MKDRYIPDNLDRSQRFHQKFLFKEIKSNFNQFSLTKSSDKNLNLTWYRESFNGI